MMENMTSGFVDATLFAAELVAAGVYDDDADTVPRAVAATVAVAIAAGGVFEDGSKRIPSIVATAGVAVAEDAALRRSFLLGDVKDAAAVLDVVER